MGANMLKIPAFNLVALLWLVVFFPSITQAATFPLHYFGQPSGVTGSKKPYGDNKDAGRYVQSDDAKIYYETSELSG